MSGSRGEELRTLLGDVVTRLFTERVTPDLLAAAEQGDWPTTVWDAVEQNGLTLPLVPEAQGGAGGTWQDAHVVIAAAGRHAVPLPLPETIAAAAFLAGAGLEVPMGPLSLAPVHSGDRLILERAGSGWRLGGTASRVPWGARAGHLVIVAPGEGKTMVALVAGGQATVAADRNLALEPRDTLTFENVPVVAAALAVGDLATPGALRLYGAMMRSAQMAGALEAILTLSVRYATERQQFGRPIAAFQAIQHNLALLAGHAAASGLAAASAFRAAERGDFAFEAASAKVRVGEAAGFGAGIAHQAHGAIGFTYEHSLHFLTRRLWSWRAEFGAEAEWAEWLGRAAIARGADDLWPSLTTR